MQRKLFFGLAKLLDRSGIIAGRSGVGKTSLVRALTKPDNLRLLKAYNKFDHCNAIEVKINASEHWRDQLARLDDKTTLVVIDIDYKLDDLKIRTVLDKIKEIFEFTYKQRSRQDFILKVFIDDALLGCDQLFDFDGGRALKNDIHVMTWDKRNLFNLVWHHLNDTPHFRNICAQNGVPLTYNDTAQAWILHDHLRYNAVSYDNQIYTDIHQRIFFELFDTYISKGVTTYSWFYNHLEDGTHDVDVQLFLNTVLYALSETIDLQKVSVETLKQCVKDAITIHCTRIWERFELSKFYKILESANIKDVNKIETKNLNCTEAYLEKLHKQGIINSFAHDKSKIYVSGLYRRLLGLGLAGGVNKSS